jgi:hypothetical protein
MIKNLIIVFLGVLFAIGLGVSQMTNPSKVIGFLDVTGKWDPSLAFVMAGAMTGNPLLIGAGVVGTLGGALSNSFGW